MEPTSYICQYDLNTIYCESEHVSPSSVYRLLATKLLQRGWFRSQKSVWKKLQAQRQEVDEDLKQIANEIEEHFFNGNQGIFRAFEYQQFIQPAFVRDGENDAAEEDV